MKGFIFSLLAVFISFAALAQKPCCTTHPSEKFAVLADEQSFRSEHQLPGNYIHQDPLGEMITIPTPDGKTTKIYFVKAQEENDDYVLVFHEWWGLNEYIKRESDKIAAQFEEFNVIALDLYDGKVASTREDAQKYMQAVKKERAEAIIKGAEHFAGDDAEFGTIGWCFGGTWSLQAAIMLGEKAEACVMYYGMPELDKEKLDALEAPVLGIFAEKDNHITPEIVEQFEDLLDELDIMHQIYSYDAHHAFANPSNSYYDEDATENAWALVVQFFNKLL